MSSYDEARAAYFKFRETYTLDAEIAGLVALTIIAADIDLAEKDKEIKARIALWKTDAGAWQKMVNEKDAEIIMWKNACRSRSKEADEKDKELARLRGLLQRLRCQAARDGECMWEFCPQLRDGEPEKSGRHCPLDYPEEEY